MRHNINNHNKAFNSTVFQCWVILNSLNCKAKNTHQTPNTFLKDKPGNPKAKFDLAEDKMCLKDVLDWSTSELLILPTSWNNLRFAAFFPRFDYFALEQPGRSAF